jgi:hypothetical protein
MFDWITTPLLTAALTSLVAMAGWYVAHRNARRLDESRRLEKVIDVQTALIAEIQSNVSRLAGLDLDQYERVVLKNIGSGQKPGRYTPFIPRYAHAIIFEAMVSELHILPTHVIGDVVNYYKIEYRVSSFADDSRGESYAKLSAKRKQAIYSDYIQLMRDAMVTGETAIRSLERGVRQSSLSKKGGVLRRLCGS